MGMLEKENPSTGSGQRPEMPLKTQAELLGISYSSLFYEPVPPSAVTVHWLVAAV